MNNNDRADRELALRKVRVQLTDEMADETLRDWLDRAEQYFFAKTNRCAVPARAALLWADIAAAMIRQANSRASGSVPVSSIKRGDTTVQYATGAEAISAFTTEAGLSKRIDFYRTVRAK